jgi:hypothetical protein
MMPNATPKTLLPLVQHWHIQALPVIRTKPFAPTWQEFLTAWQAWNPLTAELQQAAALAETIAIPEYSHHTPEARQLLRLCAALQVQFGEQPFFLGCRGAGAFLGIDKDAANALLHQLQNEGFLVLICKGGRKRTNGVLKDIATEWRCNPFAWEESTYTKERL